MRYFLYPNVCNLVTLVKATPSGQEGSSLCGKGCQFISPRRTMPQVSSLSAPWGLCGLVLWLVKTHFTFEFCPETTRGSSQGKEKSNWLQGCRACPEDPLPSLQGPLAIREERTSPYRIWLQGRKKKIGSKTKGTLSLLS